MNNDDLPDNSDSSDEDYNPVGTTEVVSEVDTDGDSEDPLSDTDDLGKRGLKRKKKAKKTSSKKISNNEDKEETENANEPVQTEEDKKKHADSLWDMFKKDTGFKNTTKGDSKTVAPMTKPHATSTENGKTTCTDTVKITQIFEFAGEEVQVEKEVSTKSAEARLLSKTNIEHKTDNSKVIGQSSVGLKGIGSVLNQLGKKQKLSTLEKTKLDWDRFKKDENIEEELKAHTKGKSSYLDRQDFLERADQRRFEIEREVRAVERNKRLNNIPQ